LRKDEKAQREGEVKNGRGAEERTRTGYEQMQGEVGQRKIKRGSERGEAE
jgi:hypothetical protein